VYQHGHGSIFAGASSPLQDMCLIKDKGYFVEILRALVFLGQEINTFPAFSGKCAIRCIVTSDPLIFNFLIERVCRKLNRAIGGVLIMQHDAERNNQVR
jgi:hypothetical protein